MLETETNIEIETKRNMSILAGRLAATEGAYFRKETKQAVNRLVQKKPQISSTCPSSGVVKVVEKEGQADVLPEVLRHSLPTQIAEPPPLDSSIFTTNKWIIRNDPNKAYAFSSLPSDARNPLRAYVSLPQVTMGPKRWQLPDGEYSFSASTVNSLRRERDTPYDPEKLKAAAEGLSHVGKAFFVATLIVFGGGIAGFGWVASKLGIHNSDDLKTKGRDLLHPSLENVRGQLGPLRNWAEGMSKRCHFEREEQVKDNPLFKELSKRMGVGTSN